jgi:hypothetical protein
MKFKFTLTKMIDEGQVINASQLPDYNDWSNESQWQLSDEHTLYFNHTTKKFRVERWEWSDEDGDWLHCLPDIGHNTARDIALAENIIYKV